MKTEKIFSTKNILVYLYWIFFVDILSYWILDNVPSNSTNNIDKLNPLNLQIYRDTIRICFFVGLCVTFLCCVLLSLIQIIKIFSIKYSVFINRYYIYKIIFSVTSFAIAMCYSFAITSAPNLQFIIKNCFLIFFIMTNSIFVALF